MAILNSNNESNLLYLSIEIILYIGHELYAAVVTHYLTQTTGISSFCCYFCRVAIQKEEMV